MATNEEEIRWRINQALRLTNGQLTEGMLERHLTSKVTASTRKAVLARMVSDGLLHVVEHPETSYKGYATTVKLVKKVV